MKIFSIFLLFAFAQACFGNGGSRPNFLFILADDLGYSDLGCYGSEIETPNLDSLAAKGLRYSQFYNTGRCWPTRAALLTGYYAQQISRDSMPGVKGGGQGQRPTWAPLLPELLKPAGYRSYHSGKWHVDGKVLAGGFDRSWWVSNYNDFFTPKGNFLDDKRYNPEFIDKDYYSTTATADHAIECLQDHQENHSGKPFFHYLAFIAPHFPLHAKPEDIAKYRDRYLSGWDEIRNERFARQRKIGLHQTTLSALEPEVGPPFAFPEAIEKLGSGEINRPLPWDSLTGEQKHFQATKMAIHAAMIDRIDQEIGRVVQQLKKMGAYENTLIFFASDNGASAEIMIRGNGHDTEAEMGSASSYLCLGPGFSSAANTPFRRHKTWVHEGGISTPLIAHWPAGIKSQGELRHSPGHVIDIAPTILDLAGVERSGEMVEFPGRSLRPSFGESSVSKRRLWWSHMDNQAIRDGDWKLVKTREGEWELYLISKDRAETTNLADQYPETVEDLTRKWEAQVEQIRHVKKLK